MSQPTEQHRGIASGGNFFGRVVDLGLAGVLFVAPLAMGGRYAPGRFVLISLISVVAISWCLQRMFRRGVGEWTWTGAEWICGLGVLLVVLQLVPLPESWLQGLSPRHAEMLPLWQGETSDGAAMAWPAWNRVSLAPPATRGGLAMLLAYVLLFFVTVQRVAERRDVERLLKWIAAAGIAAATLGLAQYFVGNGKFLWFHEHPSRDTLTAVKGTFANENHFAHFLALCVGPLIWWLLHCQEEVSRQTGFHFGRRRNVTASRQQVLLCAGLAVVMLAGLLTFSRGGIAMLLLALVVSAGMFAMQGRIGRRALLAVACVASLTGAAVFIHGQDILFREIETLQAADMDSLDQGASRRKIWAAVLSAIPDFACLGSGVGTHRFIYPTYFSEQSDVEYSHAENGYLQVMLETGGVGLGLLVATVILSGRWVLRASLAKEHPELTACAVPIAAAACVSLVHACADFNWYIPANFALLLILLALAARLAQFSTADARPATIVMPRAACAAALVLTTVVSLFCLQHYVGPARGAGHWNEYLAWSLASNHFETKSLGPGRQRSLGPIDGAAPETVSEMARQLAHLLRHDAHDPRGNIRMAAMCLRQFELHQAMSNNAMSLAQIRDAALSSNFASRRELSDWVTKAVGENRAYLDRALLHAKRGVRLCPLQGRGYVYLREVAFLDEATPLPAYELARQAYAVRPFDPTVQFAFGHEKLLAGDVEGAMTLWKDAFRRGESMRRRIIAILGPRVGPEELIAVFQPNLEGFKDLFDYYRRGQLASELRHVGWKYVGELERQAKLLSGELAARMWFDAQFVYSVLGLTDEAAEAARNCVDARSESYRNHFTCALRLREAGRLEEAMEEVRWCQSRRPDNVMLRQFATELLRQLRQRHAAARNSQVGATPR